MNSLVELEPSLYSAVEGKQAPTLRLDADGVIRVGSTRVTLDTVVEAYRDGASADEIVLGFDTLQLAEVHEVLSFYHRHRPPVEAYLEARHRQRDAIRQKNEARWPEENIRERLLARQREAERE